MTPHGITHAIADNAHAIIVGVILGSIVLTWLLTAGDEE